MNKIFILVFITFCTTKICAQQFDKNSIFGNNLILKPLPNKIGPEATIIFFQGAYCDKEAYVNHLQAI